ncbi:MAG TPA: putative DNA-binding protein [Firmicutes bacterium]|nr:putative DNA-binding protein [Bacillota bacterium]
MLEKINRMNELYDVYQGLLTNKQKEYFELYYLDDLSLSEIADEFSVSRNAVFDNIKRTAKILEGYEEKLGLIQKRQMRLDQILRIQAHVEDAHVLELLEELQLLD